MTQRWNDLLFAHWPMRIAEIEALLPEGLEADVFQGSAWIGVVPFWMDKIQVRGLPPIPGARKFPELNLRTYVRDSRTGTPGVYFFSLDAGSLIAVITARSVFHLPYYWAQMSIKPRGDREFSYFSRRLLSGKPVHFCGTLPRPGSDAQTGAIEGWNDRVFLDGTVLPVYKRRTGTAAARGYPPHSLAA